MLCVGVARCVPASTGVEANPNLVLVKRPYFNEFLSPNLPLADAPHMLHTTQGEVVLLKSDLDKALLKLPRQTRDRARRCHSLSRVTQNFQATTEALNQETGAQVQVLMQRLDEEQLGRIPEEDDTQKARAARRALVHSMYIESLETAERRDEAARKIQAAWKAFKACKSAMMRHIYLRAFRTSTPTKNSSRIRDRALNCTQRAPKLLFGFREMQGEPGTPPSPSRQLLSHPSLPSPKNRGVYASDPRRSSFNFQAKYGNVGPKYLEPRTSLEKQQQQQEVRQQQQQEARQLHPSSSWQVGCRAPYPPTAPAPPPPAPSHSPELPKAGRAFPPCCTSSPSLQLLHPPSMQRKPATPIPPPPTDTLPLLPPLLKSSPSVVRRSSRPTPPPLTPEQRELTRSRDPATSDPGQGSDRELEDAWTAELEQRQSISHGLHLQHRQSMSNAPHEQRQSISHGLLEHRQSISNGAHEPPDLINPRRRAVSLASGDGLPAGRSLFMPPVDGASFGKGPRQSAAGVRTSWPSNKQQVSAPQYQSLMAKYEEAALL